MEWYNDGEWICENCDIVFKVYVKDDEMDMNFCPICGGRIECVEE